MNVITIKVAVVKKPTKEITMEKGCTVNACLEAAEVSVSGDHTIHLNGALATGTTTVNTDGATILIIPKMEAGV